MKKWMVLVLSLSLVFTCCSCKDNDNKSNKDDNEEQTISETDKETDETVEETSPLATLTTDNWIETALALSGVEWVVPEGWTLTSVSSPNGVSNMSIIYTCSGSILQTDFGRNLFAEMQRVSGQDITEQGNPDVVFATFDDSLAEDGTAMWEYFPIRDGENKSTYVIFSIYDDKVDITLTFY